MIKVGNKTYYIDFKTIEEMISKNDISDGTNIIDTDKVTILDDSGTIVSTQINERFYTKEKQIDAIKYDLITHMLEIILNTPSEEVDDSLGADRGLAKQPISFKIAFNTLQFYHILKQLE